ncbi:LysR family transcriptional regulator [Marivita geojedonensis]|uniref:HTH lysR-type domain-containing protein n=1 Tax=Marivita geojedonensis TaxID=1123756 RepID=A0A1X4NMJ2_9RHOB|nr:LysR family transcriptional regulator [Marivita geojedonensis]OSQ51613.1 hypothetical protein MGEO_06725 [Marivita geojedonensis]PRY79143.1 DNA-binding transcriptional LysR family regulator [Marivita geojedonensis]
MELPDFNLRHLSAYSAIHTLGTIKGASERVNLSQPAITQAVGKLETLVQAQLFIRHRLGMSPTEAGAVFHPRVWRALEGLETGYASAAGQAKSATNPAFRHSVRWTQLRALTAIADHGSYSSAARALGLAQPTIYRVAQDLQTLAGFSLYRKSVSGISLTPAAKSLSRAARLAFVELAQAMEELGQLHGPANARVVIGSLPLARSHLLPQAIAWVTGSFPLTEINVVDGPYPDLLNELRDGRIDMIIGALRDPSPGEDISQGMLFYDHLGIFCGPDHPLAGKTQILPSDLSPFGWIVPRQGTPTRNQFDRFLDHHAITPTAAPIEASSMALIRSLLTLGPRLTMLSTHQTAQDVRNGTICRLPIEIGDPGRPIGIATRRTWSPTPTQRRLLEALRDVAQRTELI